MSVIKLNSVNFEHGMLLTPDHFKRQELYFDGTLLWMLRNATSCWGLVGSGPRADASEQGAIRHDPIVSVNDEGDFISIAVSRCRAITRSGCIVDIEPESGLTRRFAKADLEGAATCSIYLTALPNEKEIVDGQVDEFNPQMQTERRHQYRLSLYAPGPSSADSVVVSRLCKSLHEAKYGRDGEFIPACTTMASYSELAAGWKRLTEEAMRLQARFIELYRAMQEFLLLFRERGIDTDLDAATTVLTGQIVDALQLCLHETSDPLLPPQVFFGKLKRFFHLVALHLDLSPQVQGYFEMLRDSGETEYISVLEVQRRMARDGLRPVLVDDLALEIRLASNCFADLRRLLRALEGKYLDFRVNPALESMNFVFDRGGKVLYRIAARPSRVQASGSDMIITLAQLKLEGREKYRLILVGEENAVFVEDPRIAIELRINEGTGYRREPVRMSGEFRTPEQKNIEFDFEAPDVPVISDLRIVLPAQHPIRSALLYVRQRFYANARQEARMPDGPPPEGALNVSPGTGPWSQGYDTNPVPDTAAPWERSEASKRVHHQSAPAAPPPRRRRLE